MKINWPVLALTLVIWSVAAQPSTSGESAIGPETTDAARHPSSGSSPVSDVAWAKSSSEQYRMTRQTIDSGGDQATGNQFAVSGSVGQPDASATGSSGGYRLSGGFWASVNSVIEPPDEQLFADGFESQ